VVAEAVRDDFDLASVGLRRLKGVEDELELFEIYAPRGDATRSVDPVCGMEVSATREAIRLTWHGREWLLCSERCLERFSAAPDRYADP
jgi:YHS domain-containing protein